MELRVAIIHLAQVCKEQINNITFRKQLDQLITITQNQSVTDQAIKQFIQGINIDSNQQYSHNRHQSFGQPNLQLLVPTKPIQNTNFTPVSNRILSQGFASKNKNKPELSNRMEYIVEDKLKLKELSPKLKTDMYNVSPQMSPQRYDNNSQRNQELKLNQNRLVLKNNTKIEIPNRSSPIKQQIQEPKQVIQTIQQNYPTTQQQQQQQQQMKDIYVKQNLMQRKSTTPHNNIMVIVKEAIQQFQSNSIRILTLYNYTDEIITCSSIRKSQDIESPSNRKYKNNLFNGINAKMSDEDMNNIQKNFLMKKLIVKAKSDQRENNDASPLRQNLFIF